MYKNLTTEEVTGRTDSAICLNMTNSTVSECIESWMREADQYAQRGVAVEGANTLRRCATELQAALQAEGQRPLSLAEAAEVSSYSEDHIGRLVRQGVIPNAGRKGKPSVRLSDLPRRPKLVRAAHSTYDVGADARSIRSRGRRV